MNDEIIKDANESIQQQLREIQIEKMKREIEAELTSMIKGKKPKTVRPEDTLRLLFSSLFARRMDYLILGYDADTWFQTNISPEAIQTYQPDAEYVIHKIEFNSPEMKEVILNLLPVLRDKLICLDLSKFLRYFNKKPKDLNLSVKDNLLCSDDAGTEIICGRLISRFDVDMYHQFFQPNDRVNLAASMDAKAMTFPIDSKLIEKSDVVFHQIFDKPTGSLQEIHPIRIPLYDGFNMVSINEYCKKRIAIKPLEFTLVASAWQENDAVLVAIIYEDEDIKVVSIQPGLLWFPRMTK